MEFKKRLRQGLRRRIGGGVKWGGVWGGQIVRKRSKARIP